MNILVDDVVEGIYSLTAMSTLADLCNCPLLHPGHRIALVRTVRDSLGILMGLAPKGSLKLLSVSDDAYSFEVAEQLDAIAVAETVRSALCHITVWIIRRAAGLTKLDVPDFFVAALTIANDSTNDDSSGADSNDKEDAGKPYRPAVIARYD